MMSSIVLATTSVSAGVAARALSSGGAVADRGGDQRWRQTRVSSFSTCDLSCRHEDAGRQHYRVAFANAGKGLAVANVAAAGGDQARDRKASRACLRRSACDRQDLDDPSPSRMIATRSHRCATTARSWLTKIVVSAALAAHAREEVEDLGLHRDVERRGRLVEQQSARRQDQRARDRHALALAAGELMRIAEAMARIEADVGERRRGSPRRGRRRRGSRAARAGRDRPSGADAASRRGPGTLSAAAAARRDRASPSSRGRR